jgi:hypothetical protein
VSVQRTVPASIAGESLVPEWLVLRARRPNVLLTGAHATIEVVMATLRPYLSLPIFYWAPGVPLPSPRDVGTLLICDVATLCLEQQQILLSWLDHVVPGQTQVVSTTGLELFALVEQGTFLEALYYRLNIVRLDAPARMQ